MKVITAIVFSIVFEVDCALGHWSLNGAHKNETIGLENPALVEQYTRNFFAKTDPTKLNDIRLSFYKQAGTFSPEERLQFQKTGLDFIAIDFANPALLANNIHLQKLMQLEAEMLLKARRDQTKNVDRLLCSEKHLQFYLSRVFSSPRNRKYDLENNFPVKDIIATYLWRRLGSLGLLVGVQGFKPKQFLHTYGERSSDAVKGSNILAILPGKHWGTKRDKIVILGAHWDTVATSPGFDDNASGIAALLETARVLVEAKCKPTYSIIFAFFDLEENGVQGSDAFIKDFLMPHFIAKLNFPGVQGAFIIDSILNYNSEPNSQLVTPDWENQVSDAAAAAVKRNGSRGDFLAIFARNKDLPLSRRFQYFWYRNNYKANTKYRVVEYFLKKLRSVEPDLSELVDHSNFLRSDHSRFWFSRDQERSASFRSILLTDTGPLRGVMVECYHRPCDSAAQNASTSFANMGFYKTVVQTLIDTTVEASESWCSSASNVPKLNLHKPADYFVSSCSQGQESDNCRNE